MRALLKPFFHAVMVSLLLSAQAALAQYEASLVADIYDDSGLCVQGKEGMIVYDGRLFFDAAAECGDVELWAYDAASDTVMLIVDIEPEPNYGSYPLYLTVYDNRLFFQGTLEVSGDSGQELWSYDTATNQARLVADIYPGERLGSDPRYLTVYDDRLFFGALSPQFGFEPYVYDAKTDGVVLLSDINEGNNNSQVEDFTVYDDRLFFTAFDGSCSGRRLLNYDAETDEIGVVSGSNDFCAMFSRTSFIVYDDRLFFAARTNLGYELYVYDATSDEITVVADIRTGPASSSPNSPFVYDDRLFFVARTTDDIASQKLWVYDALTDETDLVSDIFASAPLAVYDGRLFYSGFDGATVGGELFYFDAATNEVAPATDIAPGLASSLAGRRPQMRVYDDRLFFVADDGETGDEFWVLAPTPVSNDPLAVSQSSSLRAPHPNPAQGTIVIPFEVAEVGFAKLTIHDVLGREVATVLEGTARAGAQEATVDASQWAPGLYVVRLLANGETSTRRLTVIR